MKMLALEFSSPQRSVAVQAEPHLPAVELIDTTPGRNMQPFALIEAALQKAGLEREAITTIVVGLGPGSYSGIRVALALAQGWQLATGIKLIGVSSAASIAAQAGAAGVTGKFNVIIDAQRGEFYRGGYMNQNQIAQELTPLELVSAATAHTLEANGELLIGPEVTRWFPGSRIVFPTATQLLSLAQANAGVSAEGSLEPIYLREPTFVKAPPPRSLPPGMG
jgi:tRNA threonylcarbamoyladenosine biosynthesis protein TsaB